MFHKILHSFQALAFLLKRLWNLFLPVQITQAGQGFPLATFIGSKRKIKTRELTTSMHTPTKLKIYDDSPVKRMEILEED